MTLAELGGSMWRYRARVVIAHPETGDVQQLPIDVYSDGPSTEAQIIAEVRDTWHRDRSPEFVHHGIVSITVVASRPPLNR